METPKEPVNAPSLQLCGNCDVAAAAVWCLDCNGGLCDKCELAHRRVSLTRNHRLHNQLVQDKPGPQSKHCDQHPSELLDLICLTCKTFTCKDCQLMNHMNHSYQFVSESMANVKKHMLAAVNPIRAQADTVNRSLRDMETRLKYIEKSKTHLRKDLLHFFNMTIKHLKTKMTDIVREIGEKSNLESKQIVSRMEALKQLQRNHAEIMEACEESQSTTEFWMVLMNWKKIKEILKITRDQDLSPPSTMSHLLVCTQQKTSEIIERMVFLQTGWIPFAVPQEEAIKDNVAQSDTIIPAKSSSSELCSTSSASTSSCSFTSSVLHQNTSTCYADAKQTTSMDSSLLVGGPTNVITDPVVQSSSTTSIETIHAPNKSLPSVCSQKSSSKIQTRRSETDLLGPTINLSNYSVSYPETIPPLSSHCVTSFQTALSPYFQSNSNFVFQTVPNTSFSGSSLSVTNPKATVSKKIQDSPQPVSPNQIANPTQSSLDLTFSKSTTTFAKIPPAVRCPLIAGLLEGSIPMIDQPPSVPSHYVNQTCRVQNIQKASRVSDQNLVRAPISTCARATRDSSQHLVQAPTFPSQDFIRTTGVRGLNVAAGAPTQAVMVSSPNVVQAPMVSSPNLVQASMVSSPNLVQAPMVSSPNVVQASMVSSPNVVQTPMVSSLNVVQTPMVSRPNVVQAPTVFIPNLVQAPLVSSPNLVQAPLVSRSNVVQASMVSSPNVVQAPMVSSPNVVQAPMVSTPNVVQAPLVSSPKVVQAPLVSSPNVVQAPLVSSPNVVQAPMVSSPNVVQAPMVSSPNVVQAPIFPSPTSVQTTGVLGHNVPHMVPTWNVGQTPMLSSPNVVQVPMVSCPNLVQAPMVSSPKLVQTPIFPSPTFVQTTGVLGHNIAPRVPSWNIVQTPMVSGRNVVQPPIVPSPNVFQALQFPVPTSIQAVGVRTQNSVEANTALKHQAPGVPSPNTVSASVGSLVKTMAPSIPSLGGPCPVLTVPQTELLPNVRALPFNVQGSLVLTNSETLCIPVVPQFPTVALYTLSKNTSLSDDSEDNTSNTLDPVSSGDQTSGCNLHQEDNVDNEPSTTVSEEPEPKPRESTTKVISEPATADNEPSSTVPEDPEPDENEPTTTTAEEYEQITSTYDIKAEDKLSTAERAELGTVIEHQDFKMKLFDPRVSLLRIPVSNHKPGCPLPSFHVVIEESNDQNYLKETEAFQSPTPHPSPDFIDLTDSTDEMDQDCVIMDTVLNSPVEGSLDLMEPLLLPESPFSLEVLSCSVCTSSESLIICSVCARGFHRHCHVPKVKSLSMSSWNCSLCQDLSNQSDPFSSERPAAPEDGLSLQDQRKCETLLLFLKVQTKFPMEQISKRLTLHHPSPYRNVAQFFSDVETMFNDMSQDKASHGLKKRFLEKLKETFGPEFDSSPLTNEGQAAEKNDQSKQNLRALKRRLRIFLDQQKAKKIKTE